MSELVNFRCETCGTHFAVQGRIVDTYDGAVFEPDLGETTLCPNKPPLKPATNGTAIVEHDVSILGRE